MCQYLTLLPTGIQQQIQQYLRWQDQQASLAGKLLLQRGLQLLGSNATLQDIRYTDYHRPYLEGGIDFNLSHAGGCSVCVLSDEARVGVDIEQQRPVDLNRFKSLWTAQEWHTIRSAKAPYHRLYTYWTRKEAVVKADGRGLYRNPKEIAIRHHKVVLDETTWYLRRIAIDRRYITHVASSKVLPPLPVVQVCL